MHLVTKLSREMNNLSGYQIWCWVRKTKVSATK